ncbi:hypothetical protein Y032_0028g1760 [Ancylostoma ceylanicum]|nr:hypothetical protein Y032_0028g1760 [Ancylostoma ceylanicum]
MRALTELRKLKLRPGQSIVDFCIVLEKLGQKANPDGDFEIRSMEYAMILLENLKDWPEHVQLVGTLHKTEPSQTYERIKELAISIEQSHNMYGDQKAKFGYSWRARASEYRREREWRRRPQEINGAEDFHEREARRSNHIPGQAEFTNWTNRAFHSGLVNPTREKLDNDRVRKSSEDAARKCYNCAKYGHVARNCPQRESRVQQAHQEPQENQQRGDIKPISSLIGRVRMMGVEVRPGQSAKSELVGDRTIKRVRLLNGTANALLDSGSMISIIPLKVLAEAYDRGYDVDSLERVDERDMEAVFDASNNAMNFLGGVKIHVTLEGGKSSNVAFHISEEDSTEVLIGTNALKKLGVSITVTPETLAEREMADVVKKRQIVSADERVVIPPYGFRLVAARCDVAENEAEGVLWPTKRGVTNGIVRVTNQKLTIPVQNAEEAPLVLRKGEELGDIGSEKWIEKWENCAMLDHEELVMNDNQKRALLLKQIEDNRQQNGSEREIEDVLEDYKDVFAVSDKELRQTNLVKLTIDTGDHLPVKLKTRPVPLGVRAKLREMLKDLEKRDIIEKSHSDWAFPIVLVEKKDGGIRLCVDYRELNKRIRQDSYPIPTIDAILQSLAGKKYFTTLDLCSGYWQIPLEENTKHKSAFTTPEGLFQFKVTPFGLSTSPAVFQRLMDTVLSGLLGQEVFCYIDDVMICTETKERHLKLLREVCERMRGAGLMLKAQKCVLLQESISFLGHVIDQDGLHMDKKKVEAVLNYPTPRNVKDLRSFLGMASFYRKFCLNFSKTAAPLFKLTSARVEWQWEAPQEEAFAKLKTMISSAPVLTQPNIEEARSGKRPFVIFTDASTAGIGAVLSQEGEDKQLHPIFFASKSLTKAERRYHITDLEALGVMFAVKRFHMFIYGIPTVLKTDHQPLTALFRRNNVSARVLRWSLELQRYNLEIQYVKGKANSVADALSRGPVDNQDGKEENETMHDVVVCATQVGAISKWLKELQQDKGWKKIIEAVRNNEKNQVVKVQGTTDPLRAADFIIDEGELKMYRNDGSLVYIVPDSARYEVFKEAHAGTLAGHFSAHKVLNKLKKEVYWPDMVKDVHKWTKQCQTCFVSNPQKAIVPPLKPILTVRPYEIIGVDLLELGRTTSGNRYVVSIIDHFSKFAAAYPVPDKSAETVAKAIFLRWIADGCRWPKAILSDRGAEFENKVMEEIEKIAKIEHIFTKGYNPRENGITERLNGTIVAMLRRTTTIPTEWDLRLPFCMLSYNMTPHSSTGESPFFVLHGIDPTFPSSVIPNAKISWYSMDKTMGDYKTAIMQGILETHERIREHNDRIRQRMKNMYDKEHKVDISKHPVIGDRVYVKNPAEKSKTAHPKLTNEWCGTFRVIQVSENSATVTRIGENSEPMQIPFDQLRTLPKTFPDERIDTMTSRGKRGRKKAKEDVKVQKLTSSFSRGAVITSETQPGHLLFQCLDGCLMQAKLSDIAGVEFPGAFANEPVGTVWKAWIASSIFGRHDIDLPKKIKLFRRGNTCLDETALKPILKLAYNRCTAWTEFLCSTECISEHKDIDKFSVQQMYDDALRNFKDELAKENQNTPTVKEGPVGFAAPECAAVLERDGMKGGVQTAVVKTFKDLREKLNEWRSFGTWVVTWPIDEKWSEEKIKEICAAMAEHLKEGGRIVTAWTPCVQSNAEAWKRLHGVWKTTDEMIKNSASEKQFFPTSGAVTIKGKMYAEIGSPEASLQFYGKYAGVGNARYLYETIRQAAKEAQLPTMYAPPRTTANRRGGMWKEDHEATPPKRPQFDPRMD